MKVKLQKHFAYEYKNRKHYKHVIVIPEEAIQQLNWKAGQELEVEVSNNKLIIELNHLNNTKDADYR